MSVARATAPGSTLLLFTLLACAGDKVESEPPDTGDSAPVGDSPYEQNSRAGCRYEESWDEESDGRAQWWTVTTWDARVDEDGELYVTSDTYENEYGETTAQTYTYDDRLCMLSYLNEELTEAGRYAWRGAMVCDDQGEPTYADVDTYDDADWADYGTVTYTNTYDDAGHLIDQISVTTYEAAASSDETQRETYTYDGDLLVQFDVYVGAGEDEQSYYTVEYDYGDDDRVDASRMWLGAYFGRSEGELYSVTEATWDEDGNPLTYDLRVVFDGTDTHRAWSWDEHGRPLTEEAWSDSDGTHSLKTVTWDEEYYRYTSYTYADLVDATQDYEQRYAYDGPWPWAGTTLRDYVDESQLDGTFTFAYTCD